MHRLFFALRPHDALRREIATLAREQVLQVGGRAAHPDRYHMTLQFVGDFPVLSPALHESLRAAADSIATPQPFDILLDRIGSFDAGRVTWLGCRTPHEALARLHGDLAAALAHAGIAPKAEDGFVPHVTLLRNGSGPIDRPIASRRWRVDDFALIDATAGEYSQLGRWPMTPA